MVSLLLEAEKIADFTYNISIPLKLYLFDHLKATADRIWWVKFSAAATPVREK